MSISLLLKLWVQLRYKLIHLGPHTAQSPYEEVFLYVTSSKYRIAELCRSSHESSIFVSRRSFGSQYVLGFCDTLPVPVTVFLVKKYGTLTNPRDVVGTFVHPSYSSLFIPRRPV